MDQYQAFIKKSITRAVLSTVLTLVTIIIAFNTYVLYAYIGLVILVILLGILMIKKRPNIYYLGVLTVYSYIQILLAIVLILI